MGTYNKEQVTPTTIRQPLDYEERHEDMQDHGLSLDDVDWKPDPRYQIDVSFKVAVALMVASTVVVLTVLGVCFYYAF